MPQLEQVEFFISQLFWLGVFFVILFSVLTYITLPKIRAFLNQRDDFVKSHISKQDELIKKAESIIENYEAKLTEAKNQASEMINDAKDRALQESETLIKATEEKIQQEIRAYPRQYSHQMGDGCGATKPLLVSVFDKCWLLEFLFFGCVAYIHACSYSSTAYLVPPFGSPRDGLASGRNVQAGYFHKTNGKRMKPLCADLGASRNKNKKGVQNAWFGLLSSGLLCRPSYQRVTTWQQAAERTRTGSTVSERTSAPVTYHGCGQESGGRPCGCLANHINFY